MANLEVKVINLAPLGYEVQIMGVKSSRLATKEEVREYLMKLKSFSFFHQNKAAIPDANRPVWHIFVTSDGFNYFRLGNSQNEPLEIESAMEARTAVQTINDQSIFYI